MATLLQKKAIERLVEAGRTKKRILKGQVLREAGYSEDVATQPQKVFESRGFLQLAEELGLTDDLLTKALVDDIKRKPGKRIKELELGFKVRGRLKEQENPNAPVFNFNFFDESQLRKVAARTVNGGATSEEEPDGLPNSEQSEVRPELAPREDSEGA